MRQSLKQSSAFGLRNSLCAPSLTGFSAIYSTIHIYPFDFEVALGKWINNYNTDYPHQALNNMTPKQCFENHQIKEPVLT
jgi:hypothetical protein